MPLILYAVLALFPFRVVGWKIYMIIVIQGILGVITPTAIFASISRVMEKPEWVGLGLGVISLAQILAVLLGPVVFGFLVKTLGWISAGMWLIPFCIIGFIAVQLVTIK